MFCQSEEEEKAKKKTAKRISVREKDEQKSNGQKHE